MAGPVFVVHNTMCGVSAFLSQFKLAMASLYLVKAGSPGNKLSESGWSLFNYMINHLGIA